MNFKDSRILLQFYSLIILFRILVFLVPVKSYQCSNQPTVNYIYHNSREDFYCPYHKNLIRHVPMETGLCQDVQNSYRKLKNCLSDQDCPNESYCCFSICHGITRCFNPYTNQWADSLIPLPNIPCPLIKMNATTPALTTSTKSLSKTRTSTTTVTIPTTSTTTTPEPTTTTTTTPEPTTTTTTTPKPTTTTTTTPEPTTTTTTTPEPTTTTTTTTEPTTTTTTTPKPTTTTTTTPKPTTTTTTTPKPTTTTTTTPEPTTTTTTTPKPTTTTTTTPEPTTTTTTTEKPTTTTTPTTINPNLEPEPPRRTTPASTEDIYDQVAHKGGGEDDAKFVAEEGV